MFTVTQLARAAGVSRTTVLYYESRGLLRASRRSPANYRLYGERERDRLRQIRAWRAMGLTLADVRTLLEGRGGEAASVLRRRLLELDAQVQRLREHQRAIARLLPAAGALRRMEMVSKDKWVEIMRGAGFSEEDMHRWHQEFERAAPAEHQEFLEFLHIAPDEIARIRKWSRGAGA